MTGQIPGQGPGAKTPRVVAAGVAARRATDVATIAGERRRWANESGAPEPTAVAPGEDSTRGSAGAAGQPVSFPPAPSATPAAAHGRA